jgi:MFS family permease
MAQYIPFLDNANRLFQKRFCFTQTTAGEVITVTYIATAVFSGVLGILVNKVGHRRYFIMGATFIFFLAHTIIWVYPQCDGEAEYATIWGLLLLGIGYSFYANVIVAAIPMVVQRKVLGSAIGIMEIISSLAECLVPLATATMIQNSDIKEDGFKQSSFFFFLIGLIGVLTSLSLFFIERKMKKRLDKG